MDLRGYVRLLRKRWMLIVAVTLVGTLAGVLYVTTSPRVYESTAQMFVSTAGADGGTASDLALGNSFTQARVQSYTSQANSPAVTEPVVKLLKLRMSAKQLASEITADAPLNKVLINVHVTDRDPVLAAKIANAVATKLSAYISTLEQTSRSLPSPVKLTVTHPAGTPSRPSSPRVKLDIAIGLLFGLILGLGLAAFRDILDNTLKDPEELAQLSGIPVLGIVIRDKQAAGSPVSFRADAHGSRAEGFRQLRTNLEFVDIDNPPRIIAVTSALPKEGKTHTAMNLAAALAEAGRRVCVVEADLRKPSIASALGLVGDVGLTTVILGRATIADVVQKAGDNLKIITSGPVPPNPSELLNSKSFRQVLSAIRDQYDVVIVDTAPLLPVADGAQIAALADATLLVVRAGKTTREQIRRAAASLSKVGVTPVGALLSMAASRRGGGYTYYYAEYRPRPSHSAAEAREVVAHH